MPALKDLDWLQRLASFQYIESEKILGAMAPLGSTGTATSVLFRSRVSGFTIVKRSAPFDIQKQLKTSVRKLPIRNCFKTVTKAYQSCDKEGKLKQHCLMIYQKNEEQMFVSFFFQKAKFCPFVRTFSFASTILARVKVYLKISAKYQS